MSNPINLQKVNLPFVIVKNYRDKKKEQPVRKVSANNPSSEVAIKKKRKFTLQPSKTQANPNKMEIQNAQQQYQTANNQECSFTNQYQDLKLEKGIPMQFRSNLRKQSLLDESPPHSRQYSPPRKHKRGYGQQQQM